MENRVGNGVITFLSCFLILLGSGCTEDQQFFGNSDVEAKFQLKSNSALKGKIIIDQAYLKLDRIQVRGSYGGQNIADVTHPIAAEEPPYLLSAADTSQVSFRLPTSPYDQLDFDFFLFQDNYQLVFHQNPVQENPGPPGGGNGGTIDPGDGDQDDGGDNGEDTSGDEDPEGDDGNQDGDDENDGGDEEDDDSDNGGEQGSDEDDNDDDDGDDDSKNGGDGKKDKNKDKNKDKDKGKGKNDKGDNDDDRIGGNTSVDLDHFFQNAKPSLVVFATLNNNGATTKLIFVVTHYEKFSLRATQNDNYNILLDARNSATISFDPEQWFSTLSTSDIESASRQVYQGQQVVFIHREFNSQVHAALLSQLETSAQMTFSSPATP